VASRAGRRRKDIHHINGRKNPFPLGREVLVCWVLGRGFGPALCIAPFQSARRLGILRTLKESCFSAVNLGRRARTLNTTTERMRSNCFPGFARYPPRKCLPSVLHKSILAVPRVFGGQERENHKNGLNSNSSGAIVRVKSRNSPAVL